MSLNSHQDIRQSIERRILSGEWALGARIPDEAKLAEEYGCARTTVNRALRALAENGMVIRKRKGGTRVNPAPVKQARLEIPVLREQVEASDGIYRHQVLNMSVTAPPADVRNQLRLSPKQKAFYIETIHLADEKPYAFEVRWVNMTAVPGIVDAPFEELSINEWLVRTVPFSSGEVRFSAIGADKAVASALDTKVGQALFVIDRTTWLGDAFITMMKLYYREGHVLHSRL